MRERGCRGSGDSGLSWRLSASSNAVLGLRVRSSVRLVNSAEGAELGAARPWPTVPTHEITAVSRIAMSARIHAAKTALPLKSSRPSNVSRFQLRRPSEREGGVCCKPELASASSHPGIFNETIVQDDSVESSPGSLPSPPLRGTGSVTLEQLG